MQIQNGIQRDSAKDLIGNTVRAIWRNSVTAPATVSGLTVCTCHWAIAWEGADSQIPQVRRPAIGTKIHLGGVSQIRIDEGQSDLREAS